MRVPPQSCVVVAPPREFGADHRAAVRLCKALLDTAAALCYSTPRLCGCPCGSGRIAQLVEQLTLNQRVQGSSPCAPTTSLSRSPQDGHHGDGNPMGPSCMRIFTASLATETNAFSPIPTSRQSYEETLYFPPGKHPDRATPCTAPLFVARRRAKQEGFELIEGSCFWAEPSGPTMQ